MSASTESELKQHTVAELRNIAKPMKIQKYYKLKKIELIAAIIEKNLLPSESQDGPATVAQPAPPKVTHAELEKTELKSNKVKFDRANINIYHIADVHINEHSRYTHLLETLNAAAPGIIVVAGDLLHKYDSLNTQLVKVGFALLYAMSQRHMVIIIPGNHDGKNLRIKRPFISWVAEQLEDVHYLVENIIYKIPAAGVNFLHIPYWDPQTALTCDKTEAHPLIGLYHDAVYGSTTDRNITFSDTDLLRASDFSKFDLLLLGHIHKQQYFGKNIAYPGSVSQLNFGENVTGHGFIHWSINLIEKEFTSRAVEVFPNQIFVAVAKNESLLQKIEAVPDWRKRQTYIDLIHVRFDGAKDTAAVRAVLTKYQHFSIGQLRDNYTVLRANQIAAEVGPRERQLDDADEFKTYIDQSFPDKKEAKLIPRLVSLHKNIRSDIELVDNENISSWEITSLELTNVLGYGGDRKHTVEFTPGGVIHVTGKNGVGKSSILTALLFALFSKSRPDITPKDILNHKSNKFTLAVNFNYGQNHYRVIHTGKRSVKRVLVASELFKAEESISKTRSWIRNELQELLGDANMFRLINIMAAGTGLSLTDIPERERMRLLSDIFRLNIYGIMRAAASRQRTEIKSKIDTAKGKLDGLSQFINGYSAEADAVLIDRLNKKIADNVSSAKRSRAAVAELVKKRAAISVDKLLDKLVEDIKIFRRDKLANSKLQLETAKRDVHIFEMTQIWEERVNLQTKVSEEKERTSAAEDAIKKLEVPSPERARVAARIVRCEDNISEKTDLLTKARASDKIKSMRTAYRVATQNSLENEINGFVENDDLFITTEHKLLRRYFLETRNGAESVDLIELAGQIEAAEAEQAAKITEINAEIDMHGRELESAKKELASMDAKRQAAVSSAKADLDKIVNAVSKLQMTINMKSRLLDDPKYANLQPDTKITKDVFDVYERINGAHTTLVSNLSAPIPPEFQEQYSIIDARRKERDALNQLISDKERVSRESEHMAELGRKEVGIINARISEHREHLATIGSLKKTLVTDEKQLNLLQVYIKLLAGGKFPARMLQLEIGAIIKYINASLSAAGIGLSVLYNNGRFRLIKGGDDFPFSAASGYENFIVNLAAKLILQKFTRNSVSKLLFIDEGLDCVGDENLERFADLLRRDNRGVTFMITHSPRFGQFATGTLEVLSNDEFGSYISKV